MPTRLTTPSLSGTRSVSYLYQILNSGLTDTVLLIGHADATKMYEPYEVTSMANALNFLQQDYTSPLTAALLEAYGAGCQDIWLYAAAPMSEYEENPALRLDPKSEFDGQNFYQRYYDRLTDAYDTLSVYDFFEYIVPVEAPFYDSGDVDFCTQIADFCSDSFARHSIVSMGVLGTRVPNFTEPTQRVTNYNEITVAEMVNDPRIAALGAKGKFVTVIVGEGVFVPETAGFAYSRSLDVVAAGMMATTDISRSIAGKLMPGVASLSGRPFTKKQMRDLASAKLNPVEKTAAGRRGASLQVRMLTDNTLAENDSDYWSALQMRVVLEVINHLVRLGREYVGSVLRDDFRQRAYAYMDGLEKTERIDQHNTTIIDDPDNPYRLLVTCAIKPMFGIKVISFQVSVGPGV